MDEYSIETRSERIFHRKSKEYFQEVVSSYRQGNYRSSTVMLWSVAVCDLLFKLKHMHDMYGDTTAKKILDELEKLQTDNPKSSEWEFKLVELISERTSLLESVDVEHISYLQKQRHLAAHPVLSQDLDLHQPNKETVRALIRNTLDGILTKPPIYTRKVFGEILADLESSSEILIKDETLKSYLESKYFASPDLKLEQSIIRSLWKLVFRLTNAECDKNRDINFRAMKLLVSRNETTIVDLIKSDKDYFSHIAPSGEPVVLLVRLLSKYPLVYEELSDAAKVIVSHTIDNDVTAKCVGWFTEISLDAHRDELISWIEGADHPVLTEDTVSALRGISDSPEWDSFKQLILNAYYCASYSYDDSDVRFSLVISPFISEYSRDELTDLLTKICGNCQTYERRGGRHDHAAIKDQCDVVLGADFDYSPYRKFAEPLDLV